MTPEFAEWWAGGERGILLTPDSAVYWAWEGWQAAIKMEREACALLCESRVEPQTVNYRTRRSMAIKNKNGARNGCADAIRARGNDE